MTQSSIIPYLFLATFVIVLAYGVMQYLKAKKAKAEGHTSVAGRKDDGPSSVKQGAATQTTAAAPASAPNPPIVPR